VECDNWIRLVRHHSIQNMVAPRLNLTPSRHTSTLTRAAIRTTGKFYFGLCLSLHGNPDRSGIVIGVDIDAGDIKLAVSEYRGCGFKW